MLLFPGKTFFGRRVGDRVGTFGVAGPTIAVQGTSTSERHMWFVKKLHCAGGTKSASSSKDKSRSHDIEFFLNVSQGGGMGCEQFDVSLIPTAASNSDEHYGLY